MTCIDNLFTYTTSSMRFPENCSKAKITDLDFALVTVDKNVITFEISMNHRGIMAMEIKKTLQNLPTPMFDCSNIDPLMLCPIPYRWIKKNIARFRKLPDKIILKKLAKTGTYCLRVPEVNISVTKLMFLLAVSTQEVQNLIIFLCFKVLRR